MDGIEVATGPEGTYEHVDLQFANGGPFDPATYGGDAEKAKKVRQAFLKTIPRQQILDEPDQAAGPRPRSSATRYTQVAGSPMYDPIVEANGQAEAFALDIPGATALLAEAGVPAVTVRLLFDPENTRRQNEYELIKASAAQAGFDVEPYQVQTDWGTDALERDGFYDAALFGWQSTSTAVTESDANYRTGAGNNFYGYSNPRWTGSSTSSRSPRSRRTQEPLLAQIETELVNDAFGVTIFQFPGVTAWNPEKIGNVSKLTIAPTIFYGFWEWTAGEAAAE